jgi:hypothetical protein
MPIVKSLLVAVVSVAVAGLLAVAAHAGSTLLAGAVALAVLAVALGWGVLLEVEQARVTSAGVIAVSGLAATGLATVTTTRTQPLAAFAGLVAGCVLLAFAHQLVRRDGRASLVESITGTLSGQVIAVLGAGWLLLPNTRLGLEGLTVAAAAVAASSLVVGMPIERSLRGWAAFAAGTVVAIVSAAVVASGDLVATALVGVAVAAVGAGTSLLLQSQDGARTPLGLLAAAAAPVSAVGTVAYAVARLAGG